MATWDPKVAKLSTWIGQKVRGELTTLRRSLKKQSITHATWIEEKDRWIRPRRGVKIVPINDTGEKPKAGDKVRLKHPDNPDLDVVVTLKKRKLWKPHPEQSWAGQPSKMVQIEREMAQRRKEDRARYDRLVRMIGEDRIERFLKSRKGSSAIDQKIARLAFIDRIGVEWEEKIGRKTYRAWIFPPTKPDMWGTPVEPGTGWLPTEIADELGITISKLDASLARTVKAITGKSERQLIAEDEERTARVRTIPVPAPNLPRNVRQAMDAIGPEPTFAQAANAVGNYWRRMIMRPREYGSRSECVIVSRIMCGESPGFRDRVSVERAQQVLAPANVDRRQREIANDVLDAIRDKVSPEYARLAEFCAIVKRHS
jgi:hypothetical protein